MRKKSLKKVGVSVAAMTSATMLAAAILPAAKVFAAPPVYLSNEYEDAMITRIIPSQSYIEITYLPTGKRTDAQTPSYFNLQFGGLSDFLLYGLGTSTYLGHTQITGSSRPTLSNSKIVSGQVLVISQDKMRRGVSLLDNTSNMIDYAVQYYEWGEEQHSRADYSRCVNSSVFISGEATECRLERLGNNKIQYQPYTSEGVRVAIPADEDAILTAITENWRAEPGDWGPEWYESEGDNESESGGESGDGDESGGGSDDGSDSSGGSEREIGNENRGEDSNNGETENSNLTDKDNNETSDDEGAKTEENATSGSAQDDGVSGEEAENANSNSDALVVNSGNSGDGSNNNSAGTGVSYFFSEWTGEGAASDGNVIGDTDENVGEDVAVMIGGGVADSTTGEQEVGIPDLGKETETQPNWIAIFAICAASIAGLVSWFFLFFGKHHLIKRKEKKE